MSQLLHPTRLKELCAAYGLRPSKSYGQHYLISNSPIEKMMAAAELTPNDTVVEIGPGFGVLTLPLAEHVDKVIACEIEQKLKPYWAEVGERQANIELVWGDVLQLVTSGRLALPRQYKLIANLPYQITSRLIKTFLTHESPPERMVIMVQKEVAERMVARPGEMSLLSVAVQYYGVPRIVTKVPKGNFFPVPKVDSAVVAVTAIRERGEAADFFRVVRAGFSHKRKQLWNNLNSQLAAEPAKVKAAVREVCGNEKIRAEELSVAQWEELSSYKL